MLLIISFKHALLYLQAEDIQYYLCDDLNFGARQKYLNFYKPWRIKWKVQVRWELRKTL